MTNQDSEPSGTTSAEIERAWEASWEDDYPGPETSKSAHRKGFAAGYLKGHAAAEGKYEAGHKGACSTCEPVGELNERLQESNDILQKENKVMREALDSVRMYNGDTTKVDRIVRDAQKRVQELRATTNELLPNTKNSN